MKATLVFYLLLLFLVLLRLITFKPAAPLQDGQQLSFTTQLTTVPQVTGNNQQLAVSYQGNALSVRTAAYPSYLYGEKLAFSGKVTTKVLDGTRTVNTMYFPKITMVPSANALALAGWVRGRVKTAFAGSLPPTSSSLLMGIVFGGKEDLPKSFTTSLQRTGLTHVIAASGMNVSLFAGFLLTLTLPLLKRQYAVILSMLGVGFYTLLAGFEPSIVRASIMALFAFGAALFGRQNTGILSLSLTGAVMLLLDPTLLSDIGFQLSIASTAGIMLVENRMGSMGGKGKKLLPALVADDLQTTIAAQLATLPIMLVHFQQYGLFSVLVNALLLWVIPPLMIIGLIAAACAVVILPLGGLVSLSGLPFLWLFETVVQELGPRLPLLKLSSVPISLVVGYYLLLSAWLIGSWGRKVSQKSRISPV
jgi:competence protein ComEC